MIARRGKSLAEWRRDEAAATAERERILAIDSLTTPGQEKLIADCKADPKCTPGMAALKILQAERSSPARVRRILAAFKAAGGRILADDSEDPIDCRQCGHTLSEHEDDTGPCSADGCDCKQFDR
jgi:hypothetical protein